ncbi:MAG: uroporphyrinogen-III C-methyltransferase [Candidatus Omnitrophica bacterium]|nr:uroporphyrinogen-III C-methyltransferase [Candidatus Omnitrophota bacterium]MBU4589436.1 uroporphyrinogen-III C-methyltransferase [Candidatus Omnitrophota bacterium]
MKTKNGRVYIVGAGPGDPELISVKGLKALKKADCVLYDFLSSPELLKYANPRAEKICVGKKDGLHLKEQDEINKLLYKKALQYKNVVRLKGGDPFIFSRGYEEARYLSNKGIGYEVIPGITSAIAGPESYGIPLTIKNRISSVAILTGRKKDINAPIDAPDCATLVYLMGVRNIKNIVKALRKSKRSEDTPCAFIEKATNKDSRIVRGTISNIEDNVKKFNVKPPAVLIVGEVVKNGHKS